MSYHAQLSPSSAARWTSCTASINATRGVPDNTNSASREGTCGHQIGAEVLEGADLASYLGRTMYFKGREESWSPIADHDYVVTVSQDLLDAVSIYVNYVRERQALTGALVEVEQRVPIGHFTGEDGAGGTSDAILLIDPTIEVVDAKFGRHKVDAFDTLPDGTQRMNLQLACYALGALEKFEWLGDFQHVTATIVQPFLNHISSFSCTIDELLRLRDWLAERAEATRSNPVFAPSTDACHFCKASGNCGPQTEFVRKVALDGFSDADPAAPTLGTLYSLIPMVERWCKAIGDRVFDELSAGRAVTRDDGLSYVLGAGRKGPRKWADAAAVEKQLKHWRLTKDEMYEHTLISPSTAEKLAKHGTLRPKQWSDLQGSITQSDGRKSIVLETDSRPKVAHAAEGFDDVS